MWRGRVRGRKARGFSGLVVWGLGFGVWGLGFGVWVRFRVWVLGI